MLLNKSKETKKIMNEWRSFMNSENQHVLNEGLKDWIAAAALSAAVVSGTNIKTADANPVSPVEQSEASNISKKYYKMIEAKVTKGYQILGFRVKGITKDFVDHVVGYIPQEGSEIFMKEVLDPTMNEIASILRDKRGGDLTIEQLRNVKQMFIEKAKDFMEKNKTEITRAQQKQQQEKPNDNLNNNTGWSQEEIDKYGDAIKSHI